MLSSRGGNNGKARHLSVLLCVSRDTFVTAPLPSPTMMTVIAIVLCLRRSPIPHSVPNNMFELEGVWGTQKTRPLFQHFCGLPSIQLTAHTSHSRDALQEPNKWRETQRFPRSWFQKETRILPINTQRPHSLPQVGAEFRCYPAAGKGLRVSV